MPEVELPFTVSFICFRSGCSRCDGEGAQVQPTAFFVSFVACPNKAIDEVLGWELIYDCTICTCMSHIIICIDCIHAAARWKSLRFVA